MSLILYQTIEKIKARLNYDKNLYFNKILIVMILKIRRRNEKSRENILKLNKY